MSAPTPELRAELDEVAEVAARLAAMARDPQGFRLPEGFPTAGFMILCNVLIELPDGSARGCQEPLEVGRDVLGALRRRYILPEDRIPPEPRDSRGDRLLPPQLARGMAMDRLIADLFGAISTALDEYRAQTGVQPLPVAAPDRSNDVSDDPQVAAVAERAQSVAGHLHKAAEELPGNWAHADKADDLRRTIKDAEALAAVGGVVLTQQPVVLRWVEVIGQRLRLYPEAIITLGKGWLLAFDIATPFYRRAKAFYDRLEDLILFQGRGLGEDIVQIGTILRDRRDGKRPPSPMTQEEAEARARELILAGQPVPDPVALLVRRLDFRQREDERVLVVDLALLEPISELRYLNLFQIRHKNIGVLPKLKFLTHLIISADDESSLFYVGEIQSLTNLDIGILYARDISWLSALVNIEELNLIALNCRNLNALGSFKKLKKLWIVAPKLNNIDFLSENREMTDLTLLLEDGAELAPLIELKKLTRFKLQTKFPYDLNALAPLNELEYADLSETHPDTDMTPIAHVPEIIPPKGRERPPLAPRPGS